jgi:hypothetical protein
VAVPTPPTPTYWIAKIWLLMVSGSVTSWVNEPKMPPRLAAKRIEEMWLPVVVIVATPPPVTLAGGKSPSFVILVPSQLIGAATAPPATPRATRVEASKRIIFFTACFLSRRPAACAVLRIVLYR